MSLHVDHSATTSEATNSISESFIRSRIGTRESLDSKLSSISLLQMGIFYGKKERSDENMDTFT